MDKSELKVQALLEKIAQISATHENEKADLRVELTLLINERDELKKQLDELKDSDVASPEEG